MAYAQGRHRMGRPGTVPYSDGQRATSRSRPRHRRPADARPVAPIAFTLTLALCLCFVAMSAVAAADGVVAMAEILTP